jgi:hypothetical protein
VRYLYCWGEAYRAGAWLGQWGYEATFSTILFWNLSSWLWLNAWLKGFFWIFSFYVRNSTLLLLPPLRFHCVGGCWDRTQDLGNDSHTL